MRLLERLRQGPLPLDNYAEVAASRGSLKSSICKLRDAGFDIESVPVPNGTRQPKVIYRLISGVCPCCKQEMAA